jgi:hypothetical protein
MVCVRELALRAVAPRRVWTLLESRKNSKMAPPLLILPVSTLIYMTVFIAAWSACGTKSKRNMLLAFSKELQAGQPAKEIPAEHAISDNFQ